MKISELNKYQKLHLAWRLETKTYISRTKAIEIANGKYGDDSLVDVFLNAGKTNRSAKIHATKVVRFKMKEKKSHKGSLK